MNNQKINTNENCIPLSTIPTQPILQLWDGFLPSKGLVLLAGEAGVGKTTLALDIIARLSSAQFWGDGDENFYQENCLICSEEDSVGDIIKSRLIAANANLDRIFTLYNHTLRDKNIIEILKKIIIDRNIMLVLIDPIVSLISGNPHNLGDVRRNLAELIDFAIENNIVILGITHFSKQSKEVSPLDRVIGSQAFAALARVVMTAEKKGDNYSLNVIKNNYASLKSLQYEIIPLEIHPSDLENTIETTVIKYLGKESVDTIHMGSNKIIECITELSNYLSDGDFKYGKPFKDKYIGSGKQFSARVLIQAQKKLKNFVSQKMSDGKWYWKLAKE